VDVYEQILVEDVDFPVLNLTMTIGNMVACDLYEACKKNPYVASLASGQSAIGFLEFMGSNAVQTGKTKISFGFSQDEEEAMIMDMFPCNKELDGPTLEGYPVDECTCNYCEAACKPTKTNAYPGFFDGFNYVVVIIVYVSLIILSLIIYFAKKKWMNGVSEVEEEEEQTLDRNHSYEFESSRDEKSTSKDKLLPRINESQNVSISQTNKDKSMNNSSL
jgi:hypothetical protein